MKRNQWKVSLAGLLCVSLLGCGSSASGDVDVLEIVVPGQVEAQNQPQNPPAEQIVEEQKPEEQVQQSRYAGMDVEDILASLTLEQKAAQMVLPAIYETSPQEMKEYCYGSVLSKSESLTYDRWVSTVDEFQAAAIDSPSGVPFFYGQDDVHGVNYSAGTVLFPHNIGMGAANDPELMYEIGLITADEAKLCHMIWNYAPCVAQSVDPRWGRTYESYGADLDIITNLSVSYTKGLIDGGVIACPKHFFADGNVVYGTGEKSEVDRIIDRGDSALSEEEIEELLAVYQELIDVGAQSIMISHSSLNGVKMHENAKYIQYLKNEMGFEGFIVSDWDSVQNTSPATYKEQVITAVNAGIDMLMEVSTYNEAMQIIVDAVQAGDIMEERVDDAVRRILTVKKDMGLMEDPFLKNMVTKEKATGSENYRAVAEKAVEESLVLIKNDNDILPIKEGTKVYVCGPAANNDVAQCGGWTIDWNRSYLEDIPGLTTLLEGFKKVGADCGIEIITDKRHAEEADVVIVCVGEDAYAEWNGDTEDLALCGDMGLEGNQSAILQAEKLGKPTIACIVAGRQVIIEPYADDWDGIVMCYLPGSEGQGVANVLFGKADFSGKLPSPWYSSISQIGTGDAWLEKGYGLSY
ncbi:MAG: glycoside hydrolase family 3 C-terminal domain-containing protein [Lachnospiraceae bacterium]|nr:glycoside hydrolase family 3 C-terminal domain-containing protein [Lachnospiraceae bacterium]